MKRQFMFFTLLFLCFNLATGQEDYKQHTVTTGETLLTIANKYNVTPYDLQLANPGSINNLKVDDVLSIPTSKIITPIIKSVSDSLRASVKASSISYTVKQGDTKFGISKRFGLTIPELESQNPQIVTGLQLNQVLEIFTYAPIVNKPVSNTASEAPQQNTSSTLKTYVVGKGETLYGIAQAHGIAVAQLTNINKELLDGTLREGQRLFIPQEGKAVASVAYESYTVQKGDSKYAISKKLGVSIAELERINPHIVAVLTEGHTLRIPSSSSATEATENTNQNQQTRTTEELAVNTPTTQEVEPELEIEVQETEVIGAEESPVEVSETSNSTSTMENSAQQPLPSDNVTNTENVNQKLGNYRIKPQETLYGLAKKAGMSIPDFLAINPQLKESVQIGMMIKMPSDASDTQVSLPTTKKTSSLTSRYANLRATANTSLAKKIIFFLPFSQSEFENHAINDYNFSFVADEFKRKHLEFYKGASMAIDSIKKINATIEVQLLETLNNQRNSKIKALATDNNINDYDAILMPFYDNIEEEVAAFTAISNTPVITASTIAHQTNTDNLYSAIPSVNQQRLKVLQYMQTKNAHIIVLSDGNRSESKAFIERQVPTAEFINIRNNGTFNEDELISKFKKNQLNFVVLESDRNSVFLSATTTMLTQSSNFKLQLAVLESALIPNGDNVSQMRFNILNMIYPSLTPAVPTLSSKQFSQAYQNKYKLPPTAIVKLGFDITFDSLLRLLQPDSFQNSAENDITEYTSLKFDYDKNNLGGFSNEGIYILQYDSEANLKEAN